ncbi:MAG: HEPN domain-containing protein [Solirubrobacteraceae bacterium]
MSPSRAEPFQVHGVFWRADGAAHADASAPPQEARPTMGLEEGLRFFAAPHDPLRGIDDSNPSHGTLRFEPSQTFRIELLDASERVFNNDAGNFVVHGLDGAGNALTLLDCFAGIGPLGPQPGPSPTMIVGHLLVHGEHVVAADELHFSRARLSLAGLRDFLLTPMPDAEGETHDVADLSQPTAKLNATPSGARLTFTATARSRNEHFIRATETIAWIEIELDEPLSYPRWMREWVLPMIDLIEFATREPSRLEQFDALLPEENEVPEFIAKGAPAGAPSERAVSFVEPRTPLRLDDPRHSYERMLLSAGALAGRLEGFLEKWLEFHRRMGDVGPLLFSTLTSRMYVNQQLVVLGSVAEAYHRATVSPPLSADLHTGLVDRMLDALDDDEQRSVYRAALTHANGQTQDQRIRALVERAGQVLPPLAVKAGRLSNRFVATRNHYVHLPVDGRDVLRGGDLVEAIELLVLVLHINLLLDGGLTPTHAAALVERSYGRQRLWHDLVRRGTAWPKRR